MTAPAGIVVGNEHHGGAECHGAVGSLGPVEDPQPRPMGHGDPEGLAADYLAERSGRAQPGRVVKRLERILLPGRLDLGVAEEPDQSEYDDQKADEEVT